MKHNLKQLDQFFDAARSERPLMDDDAFGAIVSKAELPAAVTKTEVMTNSPINRVFSVLRQQHGGMIMTGLGLTALTGILVTGYYLTTSDVEPQQAALKAQPEQMQVASPIGSVLPSDEMTQVVGSLHNNGEPGEAIALIGDDSQVPKKPQPFRGAIPVDSLWSTVKVESIKPIDVTEDEIAKLGINDGEDGKVFLVHETKRGAKIQMTFPPEGLFINTPVKVEDDDVVIERSSMPVGSVPPPPPALPRKPFGEINPNATVAVIMPTMVTDVNGKKLAFFFKREAEGDNFSSESMSFTQRNGEEAGQPGMNQMHVFELNTQDADVNVQVEVESGAQGRDFEGDAEIEHYGTPGATQFNFNIDRLKKLYNLDSVFKGKAFAKAYVVGDSAFDGQAFKFDIDLGFEFDSLANSVDGLREQAKIMRKQAIKMRINADSIRAQVMRGIGDMKVDSMLQHALILRKEAMSKVDTMRWREAYRELRRLKDLPQPRHFNDIRAIHLPMIKVQLEEINNLVPVRIKDKNPNVKYNQNGLIFWYSRDKQFEENAPATLVEKTSAEVTKEQTELPKASISKATAISEQMVYPNPTPGRAIFKYSLSEPRQVSMAVHDLLGKQVLKLSELETKTAGTFEKELDLSSLEAGVYLLVMITDQGEQITQRIVVEK